MNNTHIFVNRNSASTAFLNWYVKNTNIFESRKSASTAFLNWDVKNTNVFVNRKSASTALLNWNVMFSILSIDIVKGSNKNKTMAGVGQKNTFL